MGAERPKSMGAWLRYVLAFSRRDRAAGVMLSVATIGALAWANAGSGSYHHVWGAVPSLPKGLGLRLSLRDWANQGLLTGFFTLVGLEIRREVSSGAFKSWQHASVPIAAALGGMLVPAVAFALVVLGSPGSAAWGIPMATDVAFALGALALLGGMAAPRLRVFLLTLAVADDIASIVVLVGFYSRHVRAAPLLLGVGCVAVLLLIEIVRPAWIGPQSALAAIAWWALARTGVEAAVIGVVIGALALPSPRPSGLDAAARARLWEDRLQPFVTLAVLPVFAIANAGVSIGGLHFSASGGGRVFLAVLIARVVGKPAGIAATAWTLQHTPSGRNHPGIATRDLLGTGALAGVGFTVPLLIVRAALPDGPLADGATLGLLAGTVMSAVVGGFLLRRPRQSSGAGY